MQGALREWRDWRVLTLAGALVVIALVDVAVAGIVLVPLFVVPLAFAAAIAPPRATAVLTGMALLLAVVVGMASGVLGTPNYGLRLVAMLLVGTISVWIAALGRRQAQEAAESAQRFRSVLDAFAVPLLTYRPVSDSSGADTDLVYTYLNPAAERLLGRPAAETVGRRLTELYPSTRALGIVDAYLAPLTTGEPHRVTVPHFDDNGVRGTFDLTSYPFGDQVIVTAVDVTADVAARSALADSERRFRLLAENAMDVVVQSSNGVVEWISPSAQRVLTWTPSELTGHALSDWWHPDDRAAAGSMEEAATQGRSSMGVLRFRRRDDAYAWIESSVSPLATETDVHGTVQILRDVTDRVTAVQERIESEARYRVLADNASDVVYLTDAVGRVRWMSPNITDALDWHPDDLIGTQVLDLVHPDDQVVISDARRRSFRGEGVESPPGGFVVRVRTKFDRYHWVAIRISPLHDESDNVTGEANSMTLVDDLVHARLNAEQGEAERQAIIDSLLDPHVVLEAVRDHDDRIIDFVVLDANPAACAYYGLPRDQVLAQRLTEIGRARLTSDLAERFAGCLDAGRAWTVDDFPTTGASGSDVRRFDIRAVPIGDRLSCTWRDVTERFDFVRDLAESEEQFRLLADNSSDIVLLVRDGRVTWASPSLSEGLGWLPGDWVGRPLSEIAEPGSVDAHGRSEARLRIADRDGHRHWLETRTRPFLDPAGRESGEVVSLRLIDDQVALEATLERRAAFDDLTGVLKRDPAMAVMHEIGQHPRNPGRETAVLFIDIDDFKSINDTWGHAAGDAVLTAVAERARSVVRTGDTVARMGGDEFLVTLSGVHDLDEAAAIAEKIRVACSEPVATSVGEVVSSVSVGVTLAHPVESGDELLARADRAMYAAKAAGRDAVVAIGPQD